MLRGYWRQKAAWVAGAIGLAAAREAFVGPFVPDFLLGRSRARVAGTVEAPQLLDRVACAVS